MHVNFLKYFAVSSVLLLTVTLANSQEKNKDVEKVQDDMKVLQGDWVCKMQVHYGDIESVLEVKNMNKRLNFDKNVLTARWSGRSVNGKLNTFEGKFELDPESKPKKFDFTCEYKGLKGENLTLKWKGIYELTENELKLMIVQEGDRPKNFKSTKDGKNTYMLFKRDMFTLANLQEKNKGGGKVQNDMKVLQGDWVCKKQEHYGELESDLEVKNMNKRLNFDKNILTTRWRGRGGNLMTFEGKFELDPESKPKKFDFTGKGTGPKGEILILKWKGIYELTENEFKLMIVQEGDRPKDFKSTKDGKNTCILFIRDEN